MKIIDAAEKRKPLVSQSTENVTWKMQNIRHSAAGCCSSRKFTSPLKCGQWRGRMKLMKPLSVCLVASTMFGVRFRCQSEKMSLVKMDVGQMFVFPRHKEKVDPGNYRNSTQALGNQSGLHLRLGLDAIWTLISSSIWESTGPSATGEREREKSVLLWY